MRNNVARGLLSWVFPATLIFSTASCRSDADANSVDGGRGGAGGGGQGGCRGGLQFGPNSCGVDVQPGCRMNDGGACGGPMYCGCDGKKVSGLCTGGARVRVAWEYFQSDPSDAGTCDPTNPGPFGSGGSQTQPGSGGQSGTQPDAPIH